MIVQGRRCKAYHDKIFGKQGLGSHAFTLNFLRTKGHQHLLSRGIAWAAALQCSVGNSPAASEACGVTGGDSVDNGVDQLIIDGEAIPVLKDLIQEGRSPGVQEGAVRLLTRLCSTPDARQHVSISGHTHSGQAYLDCLRQGHT